MINPENFFLDLQQAAVDILDADAYFDGIPILSEQLGDLDNAIEIVIGKLGLCVIIESPFATVNSADTAATYFSDIPILVTIWEDTVLNRFNQDINVKHHSVAALIRRQVRGQLRFSERELHRRQLRAAARAQ